MKKTLLAIIFLLFYQAIVPVYLVYGQSAVDEPVVRAVMFWMASCPHCEYVLEEVLPPIQAQYGNQFDLRLIELVSSDKVMALYEYAENIGIPKERVAVPFLVIGEHTLIGSNQIPAELPGLIETYLRAGGVDWPDISGLDLEAQPEAPVPTNTLNANSEQDVTGVVEGLLFTTPDCADCQVLVAQMITPVMERYKDQIYLETIEIVTSEDVDYLDKVMSEFGLTKEEIDLPILILGDSILVLNQLDDDRFNETVSNIIDNYLSNGGRQVPDLPERFITADVYGDSLTIQPNGFVLAIFILVAMLAAVVICIVVFLRALKGKRVPFAKKLRDFSWLIPLLAIVGLGIAAYLAYVETRAVEAACGPIGDCNTVQTSIYARLFGLLPIGVLGLVGYLLILAAWFIWRLKQGEQADWAGLALLGMTFSGTLFSIYLTFLEPFVIRAVCIWCLASALIITTLLMLSLGPGINAFIALSRKAIRA